jgi:acetyl esterase/lipase
MPRFLTAIAALLCTAAAGSLQARESIATPPEGVTVQSNVVYGSYSGLALLMDVKTPRNAIGAGVLHIPGSGFQAPLGMEPYQLKDPTWQMQNERALLEAGFTVFTINHRAAPRFKYPAAVEDAQRAARFVRANAVSYGVAPDWLGLIGMSSGGHLVNLLATLGEGTEAGLLPAPQSPRKAQCVVSVMSSSDLLPLGRDGWAVALVTNFLDVPAPFPDEAEFPGYGERLAIYQQASPVTHIGGVMPEFLLIHGDQDKLVPLSQSQTFLKRLQDAGATVELRVMPGVGHAFPNPYREQAAQWMSSCLQRTMPRRAG